MYAAEAKLPHDDDFVPAQLQEPVLMLAAAQLRATADMLCLLADRFGLDQVAKPLPEAHTSVEPETLLALDGVSALTGPSYPDEAKSLAGHLLKIKLRDQ